MELEKGYKQTEFGSIPEDWQCLSFNDVITGFSSGMTPFTGNPEFYKGNIPWVTSGELNYNVITDTDEKITRDAVEKTNLKILPKGTFLIAVTGMEAAGTRGSCALLGIEATTNQSCMALFPTERLSTEYLYYFYLKYGEDFAFKYAQGTKQQSFTGKIVKKFPIIIPPKKEEQKAIAKVLTDTDELINNLKSLIDKKKAIKQGAMQDLFTPQKNWEVKRLSEISNINMGQSPSSSFYNNNSVGLPFVQGNTDVKNRKTIKRLFTSSTTKKAFAGDIIMSVRAPVGEIAKTHFDCCIGRGVCSISFPNDFLYHYLIFFENFWSQYSTGSTFDSVNSKQVKALTVPLPKSTDEQIAIAQILNDMDAEIEALETQLQKTQDLKQGMMQELLTGKTRLINLEKTKGEQIENRGHNQHINDAVIIGALAREYGSEQFPLSRFKYTKVSYLLKRYKEEQTKDYLKKAAGPYNPKTRYGGAEKIALTRKYVKTQKAKYKNIVYVGFLADENCSEAVEYFLEWYGKETLNWVKQFKYEKNDNLELLTTIDLAIEDLKKDGKEISIHTIKELINEEEEWRPKLKRPVFSDDNIKEAIEKINSLFN